MQAKPAMVAALAVFVSCGLLASAAIAQQVPSEEPGVLGPGCHFGEVIDGSTADDARRKIEAAGYTNVHGLKKSCDNFWHGQATVNGVAVNLVLSPAGKVMLEGN
jgi:hypothetical protein